MKSLLWLVAATVALTAASLASAADLPLPTKAPATQAVYNWTGFYVGANFGGGWSRSAVSGSATSALTGVGVFPETFAGNINSSGVLGGGQIGFNYEFPSNWVVGIEADIDGSGIAGATNTCATILATGAVAACETSSSRLNDFGTVRGRAGYALNNVLLYGTGGLAWPKFDNSHRHVCWRSLSRSLATVRVQQSFAVLIGHRLGGGSRSGVGLLS
jgi:outer membrane immunogenic protein